MASSVARNSDESPLSVRLSETPIGMHGLSASRLLTNNTNRFDGTEEASNVNHSSSEGEQQHGAKYKLVGGKAGIVDETKKDTGYREERKEITSNSTRVLIDHSKNNKCEPEDESIVVEAIVGTRKRRISSDEEESSQNEGDGSTKRRRESSTNDSYCWKCHKDFVDANCSACPRSWHRKCMGGTPPTSTTDNWICGECACILQAENATTRSPSMAHVTVDQLCMVLKYVIERMRECSGAEPFWTAVDLEEVPNYLDYVVKPMDLSLLEANVNAKRYGSTDAFMADARWIQHNCIVFNTCGGEYADTSKLTNAAKKIVKTARQEVSEIEACPDCYARGRNLPRPNPSWFIEACHQPHPLIWAKLSGFPFWPAKALPRVNGQGHVDVRFFGEHDRAWVSPKNLYLYSQNPPTPLPRKKKSEMASCLKEITRHCEKLESVFGPFKFAPPRIQYNPFDPSQIQIMFPEYDPERAYDPTMAVNRENRVSSPKRQPSPSTKATTPPTESLINNCGTTEDSDCDVNIINTNENPKHSKERSSDKTKPLKRKNQLKKSRSDIINVEEQLKPDSSTKGDVSAKKVIRGTPITPVRRKATLKKIVSPEKIRSESERTQSTVLQKIQSKGILNNPQIVNFTSNPLTVPSTNGKNSKPGALKLYKLQNRIIDNINIEDPDIMPSSPGRSILKSSNTKESSSVTTSTSPNNSEDSPSKLSSSSVELSILETSREPKDPMHKESPVPVVKRQSKAKKSFPNRPPPQPPRILQKLTTTLLDSEVSTSSQRNDKGLNYQLPPPEAGPLSAHLNRGANELARQMAKLMEEALKQASVSKANNPEDSVEAHDATVYALRLQIERMQWEHQQQLAELKHNTDRTMREMRASLEIERLRAIEEFRKESEEEKVRSVDETKSKQWCVYCSREAIYYCCWNTAYCSHSCQELHWQVHMRKCTQKSTVNSVAPETDEGSSQQQQQQDPAQGMPKLLMGAHHNSSNVRGA